MTPLSKPDSAANSVEENSGASPRREYTVGWLLQVERGSTIWDDPKPIDFEAPKSASAASTSQYPTEHQTGRRYFMIPSPIDLHLRPTVEKGELGMTNMLFDKSPIRPEVLAKMVVFQPQPEWRSPNRPVVQMLTSYIFVSDAPVYVNQMPPFLHYDPNPRPGVQINGRFPIDIWPRALQWAFEWHDMSKDLILKRGEPLFYVSFEGPDPSASVRLVKAQRTPELMTYVNSITGVTEYVSQTFSLFKNARERRPKQLLFPKK